MKMTKEDYKALKEAIEDYLVTHELDFNPAKLTASRFVWDLLWDSKYNIWPYYTYLDDNHIETALKKILNIKDKEV